MFDRAKLEELKSSPLSGPMYLERELPFWGLVRVRTNVSLADMDARDKKVFGATADPGLMRASFIALHVIDGDGKSVFSEADWPWLKTVAMRHGGPLFALCQEASGGTDTDADLKKN